MSGASTGVSLAAGSGSWSSLSDRNSKANFEEVDKREVLKRLAEIPINSWNYKTQDKAIRHIGPVAQDFSAAFGVGETDTAISMIDADGVALASIQALNEIVREKEARINELEERLERLESRLLKQ